MTIDEIQFYMSLPKNVKKELKKEMEYIKKRLTEVDSLKKIITAIDVLLSEDYIEDGFGGRWSAICPQCGTKTMHVVRPGKVQCSKC